MNKNNRMIPLPDQHQNFWQMASIQIAGFGIPSLLLGTQLGKKYGTGTAIISIGIGNLMLWLIGLAITAMTIRSRKNAISNLDEYIGKYGRILGGLILSFAFLFWYTVQTKSTVTEMRISLSPYYNISDSFEVRIGTFLGLLTALLCIGGIKLIKWFNVVSLPLLFIFIIYAIFKNYSYPVLKGTWGIALPAVFASVAVALAATVNLPTFFRHRRSEVDAYLALSLFVFFTAIIECSAIFLVDADTGAFFSKFLSYNRVDTLIAFIFMLIALVCANMSNIYFASAAWETIFPWANKSKELAIIGMAGTLAFTILQAQILMSYLENVFTSFIGILGVVVIIGYLGKTIVEHRQRAYELFINFICWVIGCLTVLYIQDINLEFPLKAFFSGIGVSVLLFMIVLFFEETAWAFKKVCSIKNNKLNR